MAGLYQGNIDHGFLHANWNVVVVTQAASMNGQQKTASNVPFKSHTLDLRDLRLVNQENVSIDNETLNEGLVNKNNNNNNKNPQKTLKTLTV